MIPAHQETTCKYTVKPERKSAGPADFQGTEDQYREGEGNNHLYPRTATPVDPGLGRHQPYLLGPGLLQQSTVPPGDAGHSGRSSGSRRDWYGEAYALGEVQPTPGVKECVLRATRWDEPDQCTEVITRPLLGGGVPVERLCATPRTDGGDRLPCGGGYVPPASFGHQSEYDHQATLGTHLLVAWTDFNQLTDGDATR